MTATTPHPEHAAKIAPDAASAKILLALEKMASSLMTEQLRVMFEGADNLLFEMAEKTRYGPEQQTYMDAMRIVRVQRPRMVKAFQEALHNALQRADRESAVSEVDLDDLDSWSLQDSSDLEEKIAVSNMVAKADALYAPQMRELEQRMTPLLEQTSGEVSSKALSNSRIIEAFQLSMKQLDLELPIKLVIYKLFDLTVLSRMGKVFAGANEVLDAGGFKPAPKPSRPRPAPVQAGYQALQAPYASALARGLSHGHLGAAMQPYLSAAALPMVPMGQAMTLQGFAPGAMPGTMPGYASAPMDALLQPYANSQLATEMLSVMEAVGQGQPVDSWMPAQNLSLVSRMFDDMYTDSRLTDAARPMLGKLQFPVMKVALADPTFFSNHRHPVRRLVNDVFDTLTTNGVVTGADFHRLEELLQELLQRFEPDPVKLRQEPKGLVAVTETEAEKFLEEQKQRLEEQRKNLHEKVRNIVKQELQLHLAGREPPKPAMKLLLSGFGPLLAIRYMNGGPTGPKWHGALDLLDRVIGSFDPSDATPAPRAPLEDAVHADVTGELMRLGMSAGKVELLGERLREAYADFAARPAPLAKAKTLHSVAAATPVEAAVPASGADAPKAAPASAAPSQASESVLHLLLSAGEWFRVWEASTKLCRWLKLVQYYQPHDRVVFEDFAGDNRLQMKATIFGHDLASGRSVPVNPNPVTTDLIKRLPAAPAEPLDQDAKWFKPNLRCATPPEGERRAGQ